MGVPNVVYKWKSLRTIYVSVFVMNVAGFVIVVILIVSAVKLRLGMGQYLDLVVPGEANFWPGMMFLIGFMCAPIYAIGTRLCFHLRFSSPADSMIPRLNQVLFVHCALCLASVILVALINAFGILRMVNLNRSVNRNGIIESMQEYATEIVSKTRIDTIQINLRCCGSSSFKDWFNVKWMQIREGAENHEDEDRKNETAYVSNDVPFSCCATDILRPCVHHNVLKSSEVYFYRPENRLTISTTGCHAKVLSHARYVGGLLILGLILLAAYQMVLALLSRLLQTAHSNDFYIGPKKDRYLGWILGSMPKAEVYNRLVYEAGRDLPAEEALPLHGSAANNFLPSEIGFREEEMTGRASRDSVNVREEKPLGKKSSRIISNEGRLTTQEEEEEEEEEELGKKSSTVLDVLKKTSGSLMAAGNSIPAPPPSPGKISIPVGEKVSVVSSASGERMKYKARRRKGIVTKVSDEDLQVKELRESLECSLENFQPPWKGGSPIFEGDKSGGSSYRIEDLSSPILKSFRVSGRADSRTRSSSSSSSSSSSLVKKNNVKLCGKDSRSCSLEDIEIRMKKFCKDLSTEYKRSPYSKKRRDFSEEEYNRRDETFSSNRPGKNTVDDDDDGFMIRNEIRARFNPADAYSRFRGSNQDTMMRRSGQKIQPLPPPIPISNRRPVDRREEFFENRKLILQGGRPAVPFEQNSKPHSKVLGPAWGTREKLLRGPRGPSVATYFPISSRPPRPPRLPPCPYYASNKDQANCQNYQSIVAKSRGVRQLRFTDNNGEGVQVPNFPKFTGRRNCHMQGLKPPRFSGC